MNFWFAAGGTSGCCGALEEARVDLSVTELSRNRDRLQEQIVLRCTRLHATIPNTHIIVIP
jgi:hypothetical protein